MTPSLLLRRGLLAALPVALLGAAACSHAPAPASSSTGAAPAAPVAQAVVQPGAPGQPSTVMSGSKVPAFHDPDYTQADVDFMQGMIHHHMQALQMVALIPTHTQNLQLQQLGDKIDISQSDDIKAMKIWLTQRGQAVPVMTQGVMTLNGKPMPPMSGMLTPAQMQALAAARGPAFDRLFLTGMIQHHTGALTMVAALRSHPGSGLEPNIADFATAVYTDQTMEITRMQGLLGETKP